MCADREQAGQLVSSLFDSWYSTLVRFGVRNCGNLAMVQDAVQQAFLSLYVALVNGEQIRFPKAWTMCVLKRELGVRFAHFAHLESLEVLDTHPAGRYELRDSGLQYDEVMRFLSVLTAREQEALLLRLEAMKYREIAECMGISANSVNVLLSRAIAKLQKALQLSAVNTTTVHREAPRGSKALQ